MLEKVVYTTRATAEAAKEKWEPGSDEVAPLIAGLDLN